MLSGMAAGNEEQPIWVLCGSSHLGITERGTPLPCPSFQLRDSLALGAGGRCCPARRGEWWSRLTINLSTHLKRDQEALEVMKSPATLLQGLGVHSPSQPVQVALRELPVED